MTFALSKERIEEIIADDAALKLLDDPEVAKFASMIEHDRDLCRFYGIKYESPGPEGAFRARALAYTALYDGEVLRAEPERRKMLGDLMNPQSLYSREGKVVMWRFVI